MNSQKIINNCLHQFSDYVDDHICEECGATKIVKFKNGKKTFWCYNCDKK